MPSGLHLVLPSPTRLDFLRMCLDPEDTGASELRPTPDVIDAHSDP